MKLRLRENSIRLRLLQSEVKNLQENGSISEAITFGKSNILTYRIKVSDAAQTISAAFEAGEIIVEIPRDAAENWINTTQVGLQIEQKSDGAKPLSILIEKDFVCLERPSDADNADAFPHPKLKC
jgi:Family of unknown function (DUF7009)